MVSLIIGWWPNNSLIVVMWQTAFTSCVAQVWRSRWAVTFTPVRLLAPFNQLNPLASIKQLLFFPAYYFFPNLHNPPEGARRR
jgi:hypothetical protein